MGRRRLIASAVGALVFAVSVASGPAASALQRGAQCGLVTCQIAPGPTVETPANDTVVVTSPGSDGSDGSEAPGAGTDFCALAPGYGTCPEEGSEPELPACELGPAGTFINEPCTPPVAPCVAFVVGAPDPNVCGPTPPPRPVFTPPTEGEAAQRALDAVVWPSIEPSPSDWGKGLVLAGHQYSLALVGYEGWEPLVASATITETIVVQGFVFTEDFTATITATPREVVWDTGPINSAKAWGPPTTVTCDNPGEFGWYADGRFQEYWSYDDYGGPDCLFVWWGNLRSVGDVPFTITSEVFWDLTLDTSWAGPRGPVGDHSEVFTSSGYDAQATYAFNVIEGARDDTAMNNG